MKNIITAFAFALVASTAIAADAVQETPQAPVTAETPLFSWTGFTAGVQGGYNWNNQGINFAGIIVTPEFDADFDGALLGGFVGYNYQFANNWVVGIEGDFEGNWGDGSLNNGTSYGLDWQGSVRGRAGYAFDRALLYGTAGWAVARLNADRGTAGEDNQTFDGYTVGAGVDYAFTDMIFGRVEYRYTNFGDKDFSFPNALGGGGFNSDLDQHAVRIGLGVKF